ncbi:heavy metal-associated isoprenylated plant protein 39-like isoform X1 [Zingiber officinale]|uniref:heavy metal-associated isoprenylated plant protein 39-like isoform X1 n=1 Tax=Zingiber officinale TaxID=94328 RepID=UPI001C4D875E|nr:heavy metal-associated isoprenylated plant protein 39-like isoform X1 [Zingiber officinale]
MKNFLPSSNLYLQKMVLKLELNDIKDKQKAMKAVSIHQGIDSIGIDMKAQTMTVIGSVDPVSVVTKLRKFWHTDVVSIGPAKEEEEEKKEEPKQEEPKKEETKKEEAKEEKKEEAKEKPQKERNKETKQEEPKKVIAKKEHHEEMAPETVNPYKIYYNPPMHYYNPHTTTQYYYVPSAQENPNLCNIM